MNIKPLADIDSLIAELVLLRAEHGNIPTAIQAGGNAMWLQVPTVSVTRIGAGKGPMKPVSRAGVPALLLTSAF